MSLAIHTEDIKAVLLPDGWHPIIKNSFSIDNYEYIEDGQLVYAGRSSTPGYTFQTPNGDIYNGPLTAIQSVQQ